MTRIHAANISTFMAKYALFPIYSLTKLNDHYFSGGADAVALALIIISKHAPGGW